MLLPLLSVAFATPDLWSRCVSDHRATEERAEQGRRLQRQALLDPIGAENGLEQLAQSAPDCPTVFMVRAAVAHTQGRDDLALAQLERALSLARWPQILRALAVAADRAGDPSHLEEAVQSNPTDAALRRRWIETQSPSEQTTLWRDALERHPDDLVTVTAALTTLADGGYRLEAVERGRELQQRHPSLADLVDAIEAPFNGPPEPRSRRPAEVHLLDDGTEEIIVYSPGRAKERLLTRLDDLGWSESKNINGGVRLLSKAPGQPWVEVYDNGDLKVQKSGIVTTARPDETVRVGRSGVDLGGGKGLTYGANRVGKRKLARARGEVMESIWLEVTEWRQARARVEFQGAVMEDLPDKLTALWERGVPMYGPGQLDSAADRRQALLAHWSSRACTEAGDLVRRSVSKFLELEVNESPMPVTADEIAAAEAACPCDARVFEAP